MMTDDKIQRMQQLIRELNEASDAYYNGQAERMTDYEWDARFDELRLLEQETGTNLPDSPTQKVSEDSITGQKESPFVGQDQADFRTHQVGRTEAHLDFLEVGWSNASGDL